MFKTIILVIFSMLLLNTINNISIAQEIKSNELKNGNSIKANEANIINYYFKKGLMFYEKDQPEQAITNFKEALSLDNKDIKTLNMLGLSFERLNKTDQAIDYYKEAIEANPKFSDSYLNIAGAYFNKKKYDLAIENIKKAIEISPEEAEFHYNLGIAYQYNGQFEDAIKSYEKALSINSKLNKARLGINDCKDILKNKK